MSVENGDDVPDLFEHAENADEAIADFKGAKEIDAEQEREATQQRRQEVAGDQSTQGWLELETGSVTDTIEFRGRDFEFQQPGALHRKVFIEIASETNPEDYADIDVEDEEAVEEALDETVTAEGLKSVDALYDHTLRCLCDLVDDPDGHLDDTSNIGKNEMVLLSDELPMGAARWGKLPEEDEEDDEGNVIKEGLSSLVRRVVVKRGVDDDDDEGN